MSSNSLENKISRKRNRKKNMENVNKLKRIKRSVLQELDKNCENQDRNSESFQSRVHTDVTSKNITKNLIQRQGNEVVFNMVHEEESVLSNDVLDQNRETENQHDEIQLSMAEEKIEEKHVGRRIINVSHFSKQLLDLCNHGPLGCSASDIILTGEKQNGLISKFTFKCKMCNLYFIVDNDCCEENYLNLNTCAVVGAVATGCGQSQLEELLSAINLPTLTEHVYNTNHDLISQHWERVALNEMIEAGKREKKIAVTEGNVTEDGYGVVDVIIDGCWSKRSYKKNYSALSGAAFIIGKNTGQILFLGVKNKYCQVCAMAEKENKEAKDHLCFKNYNGPSTGMESQILVEGFKNSIEQHGLVYGRLISDGDFSTHSKILEARPYKKMTVEKVECRNHVIYGKDTMT